MNYIPQDLETDHLINVSAEVNQEIHRRLLVAEQNARTEDPFRKELKKYLTNLGATFTRRKLLGIETPEKHEAKMSVLEAIMSVVYEVSDEANAER